MKRLLLLLLPAAFLACASSFAMAAVDNPPPLEPTSEQGKTATLVANLMTRYHYHAVPLDDAMSQKIFAEYLDSLDSQRMYFTQQDIEAFGKWQEKLDDAIWDGDLTAAFVMFNRYRTIMAGEIAYARSLLAKGFDFSKEESFQLDRSKASWATDRDSLHDVWRKRVKNDWLRLELAGKEAKDIRELLDDRYAGYLKRVSQLKSADVFQIFMNAYATSTDPHTSYMGPRAAENFDIAMKLSLEGIGAVLEMRNDYTQIRKLVAGGPASKSGEIQPGDRIIGVAQGKDGLMQDVVGWRLDDVVDKIRGEKGTVVRLEILPAGVGLDGAHKTINLVRDKISIVDQAASKSIIEVPGDNKTYKVGVIDLPSFYQDFAARAHGKEDFRSASRDVAGLIAELKKEGVDALIMDLRGNGGGSLPEAVRMTGLFIDTGPVVQVRNWRGRIDSQSDSDAGMTWDGPFAVLVNRGSASASEIFAAAIQDYGRGLVIGSDTFGKGTVQNLVNLNSVVRDDSSGHGELKMTIAQFFRVDGGSTQLKGVTPDIVFPSAIDKDDFGESSYKSALAWTSVPAAHFEPDANATALLPMLREKHASRVAIDPEWQLRLAQFALADKMRKDTRVSLNLDARKAKREQYKHKREALLEKYRGTTGEAPASSSSTAAAESASTIIMDDGLQANERSLKKDLARESANEDREDVQLTETARILVDEVRAIAAKPELAAVLLPQKTQAVD